MFVTSGSTEISHSDAEQVASAEVHNHIARRVGPEVQQRIDAMKIGDKMQDLPEALWHKSFRYYVKEDPDRKGGPNLRMVRLDPEKPSLTVTAYVFNKFVHPHANRFITVREAARLQGFPDHIRFKGTLTSTQLQVGNAVPVQLAHAVFREVARFADSIGIKCPTALSLFSGAGGMDIGASEASIDSRVALDFFGDACETLKSHYGPQVTVLNCDVTRVNDPYSLWTEASGDSRGPSIVFGGPPCQAFSQAGKQRGVADERGHLIFEFLRFVDALSPPIFVMENVSNLRGIGKGELFQHILQTMDDLGYNVSVDLLLAADYGAPQLRRRLIFVGCKKELGRASLPEPTHSNGLTLFGTPPYRTVGEAFWGLPDATFSR